jgi:hypothetical protein
VLTLSFHLVRTCSNYAAFCLVPGSSNMDFYKPRRGWSHVKYFEPEIDVGSALSMGFLNDRE